MPEWLPYYTIGTQKFTITSIDEFKYPALLYTSVHTPLSKFLKYAAGNFNEKWIKLCYIEVLEMKREKYFQVLSYFPISTSMFSQTAGKQEFK